MPLFSSRRRNRTPADEPVRSATPPSRSRGILSRSSRSTDRAESRSASSSSGSSERHRTHDSYGGNSRSARGRSRGLFRRRRRSSSSSDRRADLARDPAIKNARDKVADAESAGRQADDALHAARRAVRGAKDHVKTLEREALEEAKRAKMKHAEAKNITKSTRGLGRHG